MLWVTCDLHWICILAIEKKENKFKRLLRKRTMLEVAFANNQISEIYNIAELLCWFTLVNNFQRIFLFVLFCFCKLNYLYFCLYIYINTTISINKKIYVAQAMASRIPKIDKWTVVWWIQHCQSVDEIAARQWPPIKRIIMCCTAHVIVIDRAPPWSCCI